MRDCSLVRPGDLVINHKNYFIPLWETLDVCNSNDYVAINSWEMGMVLARAKGRITAEQRKTFYLVMFGHRVGWVSEDYVRPVMVP